MHSQQGTCHEQQEAAGLGAGGRRGRPRAHRPGAWPASPAPASSPAARLLLFCHGPTCPVLWRSGLGVSRGWAEPPGGVEQGSQPRVCLCTGCCPSPLEWVSGDTSRVPSRACAGHLVLGGEAAAESPQCVAGDRVLQGAGRERRPPLCLGPRLQQEGRSCRPPSEAARTRWPRLGAVTGSGAWWAHHRAGPGSPVGASWVGGPALLEERARCFQGPRGRPSAAATPRGRSCASLAVVQLAVRSPCLASGQGRLLTVPEAVAEVDGEACGPRAGGSEQNGGKRRGSPGPARPLGATRRLARTLEAARPARACDPLGSLTRGQPLSRTQLGWGPGAGISPSASSPEHPVWAHRADVRKRPVGAGAASTSLPSAQHQLPRPPCVSSCHTAGGVQVATRSQCSPECPPNVCAVAPHLCFSAAQGLCHPGATRRVDPNGRAQPPEVQEAARALKPGAHPRMDAQKRASPAAREHVPRPAAPRRGCGGCGGRVRGPSQLDTHRPLWRARGLQRLGRHSAPWTACGGSCLPHAAVTQG